VSSTTITVAVVDDAVDTRHAEFAGRVTGEWDAVTGAHSALPQGWQPHGTKVAGLALAGGIEVTGVAPTAQLLAVRVSALSRALGDPTEAAAIRWAAENGADVICCAWGPQVLNERTVTVPAATAAALVFAIEHGRGGKGCVVLFSSGNHGADIARSEYASHPGVIAVGACNRHGKHPRYSGWGDPLWCVVQSNDPGDPLGALDTYATTTPVGSFLLGETFYTRDFGFTSAACAFAAGVCARILAANPELTSRDVREIIAQTCEKIDVEGRSYDANGHSPLYGYGRLDCARAIELATRKVETASV